MQPDRPARVGPDRNERWRPSEPDPNQVPAQTWELLHKGAWVAVELVLHPDGDWYLWHPVERRWRPCRPPWTSEAPFVVAGSPWQT
jgi:hypothetical protein